MIDEDVELCDECGEPIDDCVCEDTCTECGEPVDDCMCDDTEDL